MRLVNLTKRVLTLQDTRGEVVAIPPDPRHIGMAGLSEQQTVAADDGRTFSLVVRRVREVKLMPEPEAGTLYVVPPEVAMVLQEQREDVVFPVEDAPARDAEGRLRPVVRLCRVLRAAPGGGT